MSSTFVFKSLLTNSSVILIPSQIRGIVYLFLFCLSMINPKIIKYQVIFCQSTNTHTHSLSNCKISIFFPLFQTSHSIWQQQQNKFDNNQIQSLINGGMTYQIILFPLLIITVLLLLDCFSPASFVLFIMIVIVGISSG